MNDNFTPIYIVPPGKSKQIKLLKDRLKEADALYLATDEDREGEAISWHLLEILKPKGLQFDDTINRWHTCKATDRIYASNPCSEFVFLDDTACNLASLNLLKFLKEAAAPPTPGPEPKAEALEARAGNSTWRATSTPAASSSWRRRLRSTWPATRPSASPSAATSSGRWGLGYANLGTLLMVEGLPYDSDAGRAVAASITAIMTGEAYALSAEMASTKGPFQGYALNRESMLEVMRLHRDSAANIDHSLPPRRARLRGARAPGTAPSSWASSTATATRRPRCSRPPAPSAS